MPSTLVALQALLLVTATAADVTCSDDLSSEHLSMAIDAAMMELQGTKGWFHDLKQSSGYTTPKSVFSCTPDPDLWEYPAADAAEGLLKRVLDSGELKVAGVHWSTTSGAADYKTDGENPTGYWPQYLKEIVGKLSAHYGKEIKIVRKYEVDSVKVVKAVANGDADMSEPYYYLNGFFEDKPRIESLAFSCVTSGTASVFFTKADSGITTTDQLYDAIVANSNKAIGFIGKGNYDSVSHLLPDTVSVTISTNFSDMEANVLSGALVAGYQSEGAGNMNATEFNQFETGIISPRVALFRKPNPTCTADDNDSIVTAMAVSLAVLAGVSLLLAIVIVHLIRMEKKGSPLFKPLMGERGVEAVQAGPKDANVV